MNSYLEVFGSFLVLCLSITLLYTANFSQEQRYKQLVFPLAALFICLSWLLLDEWITGIYEEFLKERMPFLLSNIQLLINLTILFSVLSVKWCWKIAGSLPYTTLGNTRLLKPFVKLMKKAGSIFYPQELMDRSKTKLLEQGAVSLVYFKSRGKIYLKKEWTYLSAFFKFAAIFPLLLMVLLIIANVYELSMIQYLPAYPIISFVLLMEIAWFLNGQKVPYSEGFIAGNDAVSRRLTTYEELFHQYKELWEDRLLAAGIVRENEHFHHRKDHFSYDNISPDQEHQLIIHSICEGLKKKNMIIDESYTTMMSEIIQEHDVMIEDVNYNDFSSYFFPALYHLLAKNKKILIITHSQGAAEEAVEWVSTGIREVSGVDQLWKVSTYLNALEQNTNSDVLIVSPVNLKEKRFLHYLRQLEKTKTLEGVLLLQAEKLIPTYSTIIHAFNLNVRELIGKKPQYIILTEWYEGLEHTVRSLLQCEPRDIVASSSTSQNLHYMVWKNEGEKWFQHKILPKISHRHLEAEVVLSMPALKANIEPIHFINQQNTNVNESIQEIMDMKKPLFDLGFDLETLDQMVKMIQIQESNFSIPNDDFTLLLIRDNHYNLVGRLNLWKGTGKVSSFVHIISPPYLIRDYLADQLDFYMGSNRTIAPLAPRLSQSLWSIGYCLLERLCHFYIMEEEVESYLRRAKIDSYRSIVEGVHELFSNAFGPKLAYRFTIESEELVTFDTSEKDFVKKTRFRIPYSVKEKILPKGFRFIQIKHNNKCLSEIFEGHIYQQYLPGQYHSFNGEHYKIQKVDVEHGVVEVTFEHIFEQKYYRPITEYKISQMSEERNFESENISFEQFDVIIGALKADVRINTSGYVEFSEMLNLKSMKVHSYHQDEQITRHYKNGHILRIEISPKLGKIESSAKIEFTLALLLSELFLSLFPDTHHFVKACARLGESFFDQTDSQSRKLQLISPSFQVDDDPEEEGKITLYIIEDSPVHLGILEAIHHNWEKIFDLLNDYLFWLVNESNGKSEYLYFGYGQYPTELALYETLAILDTLLTRKKIREVRTEYLGRMADGDIVKITSTETQCVFCGRTVSAAQIHQLSDGRQRCFTCNESAINHVVRVEPLYREVRQFFSDVYLVNLPEDIALSVLSAADIHKTSGLPFIPKAGNSRLTGKASMDGDGKLRVLVENGSPRIHTLSTLAHELTHIWQFENLQVDQLHIEELEGFASWVEVDMMTKMGEVPYANMLKEQLENRQDPYGRGYRLIEERLSILPYNTTPFDLYVPDEVGM
ncbi:hypothetical protein MLOOGBEN_18615 [Bacillus sp. EB106-08-02-XG196]|uniref:hypothetical protein n=1 Tax=Bacillus sp. EB106-08-02-XG196 TaxID=2737049 RepID=UPI0015C4CB32|nr:hypothetical protein [Bacillus sp. EB106-08-02-XG196]NWQ42719.1 hypothetical protein [Bacillus sp. EB106-08-02-XG196]